MKTVRLGATLTAMAIGVPTLWAQQPQQHRPDSMRQAQEMEGMRVMDSLNSRLDTLVNRMNRATGNRKITAMAAVINELVSQRRAMQQRMRELMESRQGMMMQMMHQPGRAETRTPGAAPDSAAGDTAGHAEHHPPN